MALGKSTTTAATGAFESIETDVATTDLAVVPATAIDRPTANAGLASAQVQAARDALAGIDISVLPRIVGSQGVLQTSKDSIDLGREIVVDVLDSRRLWEVSPGEQTDEAKRLVRYSDDGQTLSDGSGQGLQDYLDHLINVRGMKNAKVREKIQVLGLLVSAEEAHNADEQGLLGAPVVVSLSPMARSKFERMYATAKVRAALGQTTSTRTKFRAVRKSENTKNWTEIDTLAA